ncbi:hypothetical protein [Planktothrix paucivesiculata]|uniref:Uncharacterized protein n=1 Tax=Planktothrix paucivesiculata PCC 9631 TaxID=671071 RepID=A0A7Z9C1G4_9CYAN|nr:hypothetical protein [Planktothrix paucivesiculata]VXD23390.1 conserved hypothetical protein [Planktothrix paucivesiculata PCC 9631]
MNQSKQSNIRIPISPNFFCDGHDYLLTSASLGGSNLEPTQLSNILLNGTAQEIEPLLRQGICIPVGFDGDCALDRATLIVVGNLTQEEEDQWLGRLAWKLNIPCGKFVVLCGGGYAEDLAHAISGNPPQENYEIFQVFDVPPAEYLVEIYAYQSSLTAYQHLSSLKHSKDFNEDDDLEEEGYDENGNLILVSYIIRLTPLDIEPPFPHLDFHGWCDQFEFREAV